MHFNWLGQTCVKLQSKNFDQEVTILIDAYRPSEGDFPRNFSPEIALFSSGKNNAATISANAFVIDTLGEFEIKNVMINAFPGPDGVVIFKINAENLSIVHLGRITKKVSDEVIEKIGNVDVLLVPVGDAKNYLAAAAAVEIINSFEPRVVIPIAYHCDTDAKAQPMSNFIKELGVKPSITDKKIIIKKKDLPTEELKLYVLEKNV